MKNRVLAFFLTVLLLLSVLPVVSSAENSGSFGNLTWNYDPVSGELYISGVGVMEDLRSDEPAPWDSVSHSITSIVVEEGITTVGDYVFYNCNSAKTINLPSTLKSIGEDALYNCSSVEVLNIPGNVSKISDAAFKALNGLKEFNVSPENTSYKSIDGVLFDIDAKTLVSYPAARDGALYTVPDYVTKISDNAFWCAKSLKTVVIPNTVKTIGNSAFFLCTGLENVLIPPSVRTIGSLAFAYCKNLKNLDIIFGSEEIGASAFENCTSLTSIVIPDSVWKIGACAFKSCSGLTDITLGKGVKFIGDSAFYECKKINKVNFTGTSQDWALINKGAENNLLTGAPNLRYVTHVSDTYSDFFYNFDAGCGVNATETKYCSCGLCETREVPGTAIEHNFSDWVIVKNPTATEVGIKRKTCSRCSESVEEYISYAEVEQSVVKDAKYYAAITLNDNIDVNFEMTGFTEGFDIGKLIIRVDSEPIPAEIKGNSVVAVLASKDATRLGDEIKCAVSYDGIEIKKFTYSVKDYCIDTINDKQSAKKIADLCRAVINYGAYAQLAFDYKTDDLVNKGYENDLSSISIPECAPVSFTSDGIIEEIKVSMVLKSSVSINFKFTSTEELTASDFVIKNQKGEFYDPDFITVKDLGAGVYQLTLNNISANKLSSIYTVSVKDVSIKYGAYTFCYNAQGKTEEQGFTVKDKNLCKAIYAYGEAASAFISA